ncbi:MAG: T9SS type A sorting domain-containing protein [Flavobacteriales bacterium]|nr:T9SS type A sorting domain-containing protein [Flavobacteriales bacterium]
MTISAQNFIYNPGFELGDLVGADGAGTSTDLSTDYLNNWIRANDDCYHSPDWWRKRAPMYNFNTQGVGLSDDSTIYAPIYDEIDPHGGYGMLGMSRYELIQQEYNSFGLVSELNNTQWTTITLKFWMRESNKFPFQDNSDLKVYFAKKKMKYKVNNPVDKEVNGFIVDCNSNFCSDKYRKYTGNNHYEILTIPASAFGTVYPRGEWHQVVYTFTAPSNIQKLDWIVFDAHAKSGLPDWQNLCNGGYIFIDDIELLIGCEDECSRTDGAIGNVVLGNYINADNSFTMALPGPPGFPLPLDNIKSLRLEISHSGGGLTVFDETIECINGLDHILYWDGTTTTGNPVANALYHYRITVVNDCGEQQFTGSLLKEQDYAGPDVTNFDQPCTNGINVSPEPCCYVDLYVNNETLIGPDPGWSEFIVARHIWVCTAQPDYSDMVTIEDSAKVLYRAGQQITLREGFNTEKGAVFCAEIKACRETGPGGGERLAIVSGEDDEDKETQGIDENSLIFNVYPNPSRNGKFNMEVLNNSPESYIEVLNLMGTIIYTANIGSTKVVIDISDQAKGIYLIRIVDGEQTITKKVIYN